jgi:SAM-dependent methyltransferase
MNLDLQCPRCKKKLKLDFSCSNCLKNYFDEEGFFDFIDDLVNIEKADEKISELLSKVHTYGYSNGVQLFLRKNPEFEYRFNKMEGSIAFRTIKKNNIRCLIINSDLGNIVENLSHVFDEVYSLEEVREKILIQNMRFQKTGINNIILIRSVSSQLPFPDGYFDLVVSDGLKLNKDSNEPSKRIHEYFNEIKRVLTSDGCLCIGVKNSYGLGLFGIDKSHCDNMYASSFSRYQSFFNYCGFRVKSFWAIPSYRKPHYSGNMEDDISLKWFFHNFDKKYSVDKRFKILGLFLRILNNSARKTIMKMFSPTFLFYCYANEIPKTFEEIIVEQTGFRNFVQNVRLTKIMYVLLNENGNPEKIMSCKISKYDLNEKIISVKRVFPNMKDPDEKIILDEWYSGEVLNRLDGNDITLAINWLVDFQNKTRSELLGEKDIEEEIVNIERDLEKIDEMSDLPYREWLGEYKIHANSLKLRKTAVHGDLQVRNILIDHKRSSVNVIDWDWRFQEKGNPLYDFIWLTANIMMLSNDMVNEFRTNLNGSGKASKIIEIIKKNANKHFHAELDFIKLLRFIILRFITIKVKEGNTGYLQYIELLKILQSE